MKSVNVLAVCCEFKGTKEISGKILGGPKICGASGKFKNLNDTCDIKDDIKDDIKEKLYKD